MYVFSLKAAHEARYLVRVRCQHCCIKRNYEPSDLRQLVGDVGKEVLAARMRCERCRRTEYMEVEFWYPTAAERQGIRIRRLVGTKMVRKVIWRDD